MGKRAHILAMLATALDRGEGTQISPNDVRRHIEKRDLFEFLNDQIPSFRSRYLVSARGEPILEEFERILSDTTRSLQEMSVSDRDFPINSGLSLLFFLGTAALERESRSRFGELSALRSKRLILFKTAEHAVYSIPSDSDASSCVYVSRGEKSAKFRLDPFRVLQNNGCGGVELDEMTRLVRENQERISRVVEGIA